MSVIVGVISARDGAVASDGRRFNSVTVTNGVPDRPVAVDSDEFDKTFSLYGGKIVGVWCGLLGFSGRTVAQHIAEIVGDSVPTATRFRTVFEQVAQGLSKRLKEIDNAEVDPSARSIDLILVGGEELTRSNMRIASARLRTDGATSNDQPGLRMCWAGDEKATAAVRDVMAKRDVRQAHPDILKRWATDAIEAGIRASGDHRLCTGLKACGGRTFFHRTWYS